jgi:CheY-like chemotaxis protein
LEVLKQIMADEHLKDSAVIVLTASERSEDIIEAYKDDVQSYSTILKSAVIVSKTGKIDGFLDAILSIR